MISFSRALRISRPRFWMYLVGPYLLGVTAANPPLTASILAELILIALYFTLPANLMVYGVNDICDYDTDRLNPKKQEYEALVLPTERKPLIVFILAISAPFAALLCWNIPSQAALYLAVFVLLSVFYSAKPIRAKARPIVDSVFNILYAMPGFFGWALAGGGPISPSIVFASLFWTMAMHAFSAVPDIESDRKAGLGTIATTLGRRLTIVACLALYVLSAILLFPLIGLIALAVGAVYVGMMIVSLPASSSPQVMRLYQLFPAINTAVGFVLFVTIFALKHLHM